MEQTKPQVSEKAVRAAVAQVQLMKGFYGGGNPDVLFALAAHILEAATAGGIDDACLSRIAANFARNHREWPGIEALRLEINPPMLKLGKEFDTSIYEAPELTDAEREQIGKEIADLEAKLKARRG